jgi:hypothetical protein
MTEPRTFPYTTHLDIKFDPLALIDVDAADVVSYLTSLPPGDAANSDQRERLQAMVETALRNGGGVLPVQRSSGYFVAQKRKAADAR